MRSLLLLLTFGTPLVPLQTFAQLKEEPPQERSEEVYDGANIIHKRLFWTPFEQTIFDKQLEIIRKKMWGEPDNGDSTPTDKSQEGFTEAAEVERLNRLFSNQAELTTQPSNHETVIGPEGLQLNGNQDPRQSVGEIAPNGGYQQLDNNRQKVSETSYFANFSPSIAPYKRGNVHNQVELSSGIRTSLNSGAPRPYPVTKKSQEGLPLERFSASFLLNFQSDNDKLSEIWVPIPSIAPNQRISNVITEPPNVPIKILTDDADNFYVASPHRGVIRFTAEISVTPFYFNGFLDPSLTWDEYAQRRTQSQISFESFPQTKAAEISRFLSTLGISRKLSPSEAIRKLVTYFREFDVATSHDKTLPSGPIPQFKTFMHDKLGVCRHRAILFLVAARALGLSARYVNNEAHAFVELYWPAGHSPTKPYTRGNGYSEWRRIDLGGAASHISFSNIGGKAIHQRDDLFFPKPPNYLEHAVSLPTPIPINSTLSTTTPTLAAASSPGGVEGGFASSTPPGVSPENVNEIAQPSTTQGNTNPQEGRATISPNEPAQAGELLPQGKKRTETSLEVIDIADAVRRGESTTISVRLHARKHSLVRRRVAIYISPVGEETPTTGYQLGSGITNALGEAYIEVKIPSGLRTGRWSIYAYFAGDNTYTPAISN